MENELSTDLTGRTMEVSMLGNEGRGRLLGCSRLGINEYNILTKEYFIFSFEGHSNCLSRIKLTLGGVRYGVLPLITNPFVR